MFLIAALSEPFSLMPVITAVMLIGFYQSIDSNVRSHEEEWASILQSIFVCIETKSIDSAQRMQAAYSGIPIEERSVRILSEAT